MWKKLETQFGELEKNSQVIEVKDNLFSMVERVSSDGTKDAQTGKVQLRARIVVDRLCMCIALVALNTFDSCWTSSIEDIVAFGSDNPHKCYLALLILKAISEEAENQNWADRRKSSSIKTTLREKLSKVLDFICQILQTRG